MRVNHRILLTCAFLAVVAAFMALHPAPTCAIGDIHLIVVCSSSDSDPVCQEQGETWKKYLEAIMGDEISYAYFPSPRAGAFAAAGCHGAGFSRNDYATYRILTGQGADPRNVASVCREVSQAAGSDDAIVVFIWSRAENVPGRDGKDRHVLFPMATSDVHSERGVGLPRPTILKNLNAREHRLIVLITFSYEKSGESTLSAVSRGGFFQERLPVPKEPSYFKRLLQDARGEININFDVLTGSSHLMDPFNLIALNGLYLETEINPDDFNRLLRFACDLWSVPHIRGGYRIPYRLTIYGENQVESVPERSMTFEEIERECEDRREKLTQSGEFDVEDREIQPWPDYFRPSVSDSDDDDFEPAPPTVIPM